MLGPFRQQARSQVVPPGDKAPQVVPSGFWRILLLLTALVSGVGGFGCVETDASPELLKVFDFTPREAEVGDRLEVLGSGFPEGRPAKILFRGTLYRPGRPKVTGAEVEVAASSSTESRIELALTDGLEAAFCGAGEQALHTTFEGDVIVSFASSAEGSLPVTGSVRNVRIDFRAVTPRRAVMRARDAEGERALAFMGMVPGESPLSGGLTVQSVRQGSPADQAGIAAGDLLTRVDGVRVFGKSDVNPTGTTRYASLAFLRSSEGNAGGATSEKRAERTRQVDIVGFRPSAPSDLMGAGLILLLAAAILLFFMAPVAGIITWVERRVSARIQSRIGPNRAGPQGFFVWIADGIKSIVKEDVIPRESDHSLFRLAPYLVFLGVSATFCVMPFGQQLIAADLDLGILYVISVTSLVTIGLMMGGWASNNKWSMLGGVRAAAQIVSYEIPGAVAIVCIVMMTGSLRVQDIIKAQGGLPWEWFLFKSPVTFCLFFLWFITALAEGNRAPFDLPEAESELVAGYSTEYSGMRYLFFFFAEWANVFVMCGIGSTLFLGGWQLPFVSPYDQESRFALQCLGAVVFQLKSWLLIFVVIWIRWTLPRIRIDQMMSLCWKYLVPASLLGLVLTGVWMVYAPLPEVQSFISMTMFAGWLLLFGYFCVRVRYNLRATHSPVHLNPFL